MFSRSALGDDEGVLIRFLHYVPGTNSILVEWTEPLDRATSMHFSVNTLREPFESITSNPSIREGMHIPSFVVKYIKGNKRFKMNSSEVATTVARSRVGHDPILCQTLSPKNLVLSSHGHVEQRSHPRRSRRKRQSTRHSDLPRIPRSGH